MGTTIDERVSERRADAARADTLRHDVAAQRRALYAREASAVELEPVTGGLPALTRSVRAGLGHGDQEPLSVRPAMSGASAQEQEGLVALFMARHEAAA